MRKWGVGLDPGFGETGVFLFYEDESCHVHIVAWATFKCPPGGKPDLARAVSLAGTVVNILFEWIQKYDIKLLDIAIELPIYKRSSGPQTLIKQARLLQEIESGIFHIIAGELTECWLTEVSPSTSKRLANCPMNRKPVAESPVAETPGLNVATREALADAWAHSLATWGVAGKRRALHGTMAAEVTMVCEEPDTGNEYGGGCRHIEETAE